jgi:iron(III) transport system ATP-binding protein
MGNEHHYREVVEHMTVSSATKPTTAEENGANGASAISISHLKKTFVRARGKQVVNAIDDISLDVKAGEMVVLLGPSGCGKTTLLRTVAGLETPESGEIRIGGRRVFSGDRRGSVPTNRRDVSMIFQSYALWPHMTVGDNIAYPLQSDRRNRRTDIGKRVDDVIDLVGLGGLKAQYPGTLSGGQQQRVSLARAIVAEPAVILFDEPLSNVDAQVRNSLRREISALHEKTHFAGLYVTHDQEEALGIATRIAVLDAGRIVQLGTPQEIYDSPATPYVARFVGRANAITVTISSIERDHALLEGALGKVQVTKTVLPPEAAAHSEVVVVVRPEDIEIVDAATPAPPLSQGTRILGRVMSLEYKGAGYETIVNVGEANLRVAIPKAAATPTLGDEVGLWMPAAKIRVLAA